MDASMTYPNKLGMIRRLDPDVVNKVAAAEVIVTPHNALKEILENSLDAGATNIEVLVKDGGFKLLRVSDNGTGISEADLPLLCERHTTSKLKTVDDLQRIATLGFRGEALASISHISHLSVLTKTADEAVAIKATYENGVLVDTKKTAGLQGTQITIEDLFFNTPSRAKALKNKGTEEYQRILNTVCRYGINYPASFSCKREGESQPYVIPQGSTKDKIRRVFGSAVAADLVELDIPADESIGLQKIHGYVTSANYHSKKSVKDIVFVNRRLVDWDLLRRALNKLYSQYIPKGTFAFVYLSIEVDPSQVDVNMHPNKLEVKILDDTAIVNTIVSIVEELLVSRNTSRTYKTQSYIASTTIPDPVAIQGSQSQPRYEHKLVRTDPQQQAISDLTRQRLGSSQKPRVSQAPGSESEGSELASSGQEIDMPSTAPKQFEPLNLQSLKNLREHVQSSADAKITNLMSNHTLVGLVDPERSLAAVQFDVRLYLVDYDEVALQLFYQLALRDIGNYGTIHLGDGIKIVDLIRLVEPDFDGDVSSLVAMAPMFESYYEILIRERGDEVIVTQLPLLLAGYVPPMARLPEFFRSMVDMNYQDEQECLGGICWALAKMHVPVNASAETVSVLFDAAKRRLIGTRDLNSAIVEIANLPGLYRVFERC